MQETAERTKNNELMDEVILCANDSALNRGMSIVARNRVMVGLARGLESLSYGEGDDIEQIRAAIRAAGTWLIKVADEAE